MISLALVGVAWAELPPRDYREALLGAVESEADRLIAYHSPISQQLTLQRTSYASQLIPVTPYILVACAETFYRYPEMMRVIDAARPAEDIALDGHRPGSRINAVHLWSIANFYLLGRQVVTMMDPSLDVADDVFTVLDFWERAALAYRHHDGTRQAWDAGDVVRPFGPDVLDTLLAGVQPVDDDTRRIVKRANATIVNYLFLSWFDTRVGTADSGPYPLPDGRTLLVREWHRLADSDFWWTAPAAGVPRRELTAALVLEGVDVKVTDFGSAFTQPEDYLDHLVGFGLFTTDHGGLAPVELSELPPLLAAVKTANAQLYRDIAAMPREELIRCGAYVYFTFLRPFAEAAGVADQLDWEVPKAVPEPVVQLLSSIDPTTLDLDPAAEYYSPLR